MPKSNARQPKKLINKPKIYLDYAASVLPNAGSIHSMGQKTKGELENARLSVASVLKCSTEELIFTSGGTESNNIAIQGVVYSYRSNSKNKELLPHIVTTNIEHPSVLETVRMMKERNLADVTVVEVEPNGIVDPKKIRKSIKKNTVLVSVMYVNNEIGTLQPVREIAKAIRHYKKKEKFATYPYFHTDAVQAANYLDLTVEKLGVDLLSLSGTKIEDAGRVGVLYKKRTATIEKIYAGGDQEYGLRPGTENVEAINKFAKGLKLGQERKEKEYKRLTKLQNYFLERLNHLVILQNDQIRINGDMEKRLPSILNITFGNIPSDLMVIELSARGIMASPQSACKSSSKDGSYVIQAIRPESDIEVGGVRFSFGKKTTKKEISRTVKTVSEIVSKLAKWYPK